MDTSSGSAIIIVFMIIIFAGFAAAAASVFKARNGNKPKPPRENNPWQNQNNGEPWGQGADKPGNIWEYKQNGQPLQPPQKTKAETDEAVKAEEKARIQKERELEQRRRIAEASGEVHKYYQAPRKDMIGNVPQQTDAAVRSDFINKTAPKAVKEEEEALFGFERAGEGLLGSGRDEDRPVLTGNAPRQAENRDGELEALEFEAEAERQNLAILQSSGPMETGRITKAESVSENYCRLTFAIQTFEGTLIKYAVVKKDAKYMPDTAHYILLDSGDKDRCTVL